MGAEKVYFSLSIVLLTFQLHSCHIIFTHSPQTQVATIGDDLIFNCLAYDDTSPGRNLTYSWYLNAGPLSSRSAIFSNHSLLVRGIHREDVGNYTCVVYTGDGTTPLAVSPSATIILAYINSFVMSPTSVNVTEGSTISLECVTGESAPPPQVFWERDAGTFTQGSQYNTTYKSTIPSDLMRQISMKLVMVAHPSHTGKYNCMARNPMLNVEVRSMQVMVTVTAIERAPFFNTTLYQRNILVARGSNLLLHCPISGFPLPKITWYRENKKLASDEAYMFPNGTLYFVGLRDVHEAYYECTGRNELGSYVSPEIILQLAYIDLEFEREPDPIFVVAGQPMTMPCSPPISFPPANVTWYRNNQPLTLPSSGQAMVIVDSPNGVWDLFVASVQKEHEGEYFCVATNSLAIPMSRTSRVASLKVGGAPIFIVPPVDHRVVKGQGLQLQCLVEGDPVPRIDWFMDRIPLDEGPKVIKRLNGQELHIRDIDKSYQGSYMCKASNIYGKAEMTAQIFVVVPPVITDPVPGADTVTYTPTAGDTVTIRCATYGDPTPNITWYKDNVLLDLSNRHNMTVGGLQVRNVSDQDSGEYTCLAINEGGTAQVTGRLEVQVPPFFVRASNDTAVLIGQSLTLECEVTANPAALLRWLYNNTYSLPQGVFLSSDKTSLSVSMVSWQQVGTYTCIASNSVGSISRVIKVSLQVPPDINMIVGNTVVYLDHDTELTCAAAGIPFPDISWYRHGNVITSSKDGRFVITTAKHLLLRFVQTVDAGEYSCRAVNIVGTAEKSVSLYVIEPPLPPLLLTPVTRSSSSVTLTWTPATQRPQTVVDHYTVYFKTRETFDYQKVDDVIPFGQLSFIVLNLRPGIEYVFKMSATNKAGEGGKSNSKSAKTFDSGPSEPRNVQIKSVNASSVQLQWELPLTTNGIVRKYKVWYRLQEDAAVMQSVEVAADQPTVTVVIPELRPYSGYEFSIQAATVQDDVDMWGKLSPIVTTRTAIGVPSGSPSDFSAMVISSTTIQLKWKPVPRDLQNGPITMYKIRYKMVNGSQYTVKNVTNTSLEVVNINNLLPWRTYMVAMAAGTEAGVGPYSSAVTVRTAPEAPVASPFQISLTALSFDVIQVKFQLPDNETWNSDLSGSVVRIRKSGFSTIQVVRKTDLDFTTVNISDLEPWTLYEVSVAVFTDLVTDGAGPYSEWQTVRTLESEPGEVSEINYQSTPTSVELSWQPPLVPNGVILGYTVMCTSNSNLGNGPRDNTTYSTSEYLETGQIANITTEDTAVTFTDLIPSSDYNISIAAFNSVGHGPEKYAVVMTEELPEPPPPSTYTDLEEPTSTSAAIYQASRGDNSEMLPTILAGCAAGVVLILFVVVLIMCLCIKQKEKDRQALYNENAGSDAGIGEGEPESESSGSSTKIVGAESGNGADRGSLANVDLTSLGAKFHKPQEYSDMRDSQSMAGPGGSRPDHGSVGIENPGYREDPGIGITDLESMAVSMDFSAEELYSQASTTLKRKSKMKNESAAAIAALRNKNLLSRAGDRDSLIDNDTVVVYAERTAL